jgi:hypothetical protein
LASINDDDLREEKKMSISIDQHRPSRTAATNGSLLKNKIRSTKKKNIETEDQQLTTTNEGWEEKIAWLNQ